MASTLSPVDASDVGFANSWRRDGRRDADRDPEPPAAQQATAASAVSKNPVDDGTLSVLPTDFDIVRMAVTNPAVADATVVQQREILHRRKSPGTISLIIWGPDNQRIQYDVVVEQPISNLDSNSTCCIRRRYLDRKQRRARRFCPARCPART